MTLRWPLFADQGPGSRARPRTTLAIAIQSHTWPRSWFLGTAFIILCVKHGEHIGHKIALAILSQLTGDFSPAGYLVSSSTSATAHNNNNIPTPTECGPAAPAAPAAGLGICAVSIDAIRVITHCKPQEPTFSRLHWPNGPGGGIALLASPSSSIHHLSGDPGRHVSMTSGRNGVHVRQRFAPNRIFIDVCTVLLVVIMASFLDVRDNIPLSHCR